MGESEKKPRYGLTILVGILLIVVLAPLSQFLTIMATNASVETATPVAWAIGIIVSLVLVNLVFGAIVRQRLLSRSALVLLYTMLTVAVPLMNLGLVRQFVVATQVVMEEYVYHATATYHTAYGAQDPDWFPVVPTEEGLAWNRADRLLRLLLDAETLRERRDAVRELTLALTDPVTMRTLDRQLRSGEAGEEIRELEQAVARLGEDEVVEIRQLGAEERLQRYGLVEDLERQFARAQAASDAALEELRGQLPAYNEWAASMLPVNLAAIDVSSRERLDRALGKLSQQRRAELEAQVASMSEEAAFLRTAVTSLSTVDRGALRTVLKEVEEDQLAALGEAERDTVRELFVLRLSRAERRDMLQQDGTEAPNQNLRAFHTGVFHDAAELQAKQERSTFENVAIVFEKLPWNLWIGPLLWWGVLFTAIFLFLMCLAEWFRRKWVDRENLPFPVVEVVDNIIRHDYRLETSADALNPDKRGKNFNPFLLIGAAVGFLILSLEAMGHYEIFPQRVQVSVNVSDTLLTAENFRDIRDVIFVISPIVVGLVFLLSLELSFSIWFLFVLFTISMWVIKLAFPELKDSNFTGFTGGKLFPFPMEQFVGAALCFTGYLLFKTWGGKKEKTPMGGTAPPSYVPPLLTRAGLLGLPVVIVALFWFLGVTSLFLIGIAAVIVLAQAIAIARIRAETGLPQYHSYFEMTKLPMITGLTDEIGSRTFATYVNTVFLPASLLFRSLGIQLENIELARRNRVPYKTVAIGALGAFLTAIGVGSLSFLAYSYYIGEEFYAAFPNYAGQGDNGSVYFATMPLWVSHFLGESGLESYSAINWLRMGYIGLGFGVVGVLLLLRHRFLSFPLHPLGYILVLGSFFYPGVSPYTTHEPALKEETTVLWGSAFVAWLIKFLVVKYGGMNAYKEAKPFFIGLVIGAVFCVFFWNSLDLISSMVASGVRSPGEFLRLFLDKPPFTPAFY